MLLAFVDIQHEKITTHATQGPPHNREFLERTDNIAQAVGMPCLPVHYRDVSMDWARRNGVQGLFISGNTPDWAEYDWDNFRPLQEIVLSGEIPVLGFCGGHQLIGMTFGAPCGPLGPLEAGEEDLMPNYHPGMRKERGYLPLLPSQPAHPLFGGFADNRPVIMESHYWEIKTLPESFHLLASTPWCTIQVMQHGDIPVYGIQGHPEAYTAQYPDGKQFIRNFAQTVGIIP
jgi:GMP synthase-like glutamine amidotransferase